jgi:hypothetical protein
MTDPSYRVTWTATALDMVAAIPDRRVQRILAAVGRRKHGDTADIYELARKLIRQRLIRP